MSNQVRVKISNAHEECQPSEAKRTGEMSLVSVALFMPAQVPLPFGSVCALICPLALKFLSVRNAGTTQKVLGGDRTV